jgi:hypothetical protein
MTPPTLYSLTRGHQDGHVTELFWHPVGPAPAAWEAICDGLLEEAARRAVAKAASEEVVNWVGMGEIMDQMAPMLEGLGFVRVRPVDRYYYDATIIRRYGDGEGGSEDGPSARVVDIVDPHNLAIERQQWEEAGRMWDEPT